MRNADEDVAERPMVKCVVWDLDNTLWKGVLLEDPRSCCARTWRR